MFQKKMDFVGENRAESGKYSCYETLYALECNLRGNYVGAYKRTINARGMKAKKP